MIVKVEKKIKTKFNNIPREVIELWNSWKNSINILARQGKHSFLIEDMPKLSCYTFFDEKTNSYYYAGFTLCDVLTKIITEEGYRCELGGDFWDPYSYWGIIQW